MSSVPILAPPPTPSLPLRTIPQSRIDLEPLANTVTALLSVAQLSPTLLPMPHLHHQLLLKVAINSVINPLTAVLGAGSLPNGALFGSTPSHRLIRDLVREASDVLTAYLHSLSAPHSPPFDVIRLFSVEGLERRILALIRATAENTSSMAVDVSKGRTTEIEHINGYLMALGNRLGIETPCHKMIREMVKFTAQVNGLQTGLNPDFVGRVADRRSDIAMRLGRGRKLNDREMAMEEKRLELEERRLYLQEEQALVMKRARRRIAKSGKAIMAAQEELKASDNNDTGNAGFPGELAEELRTAHQAMAASTQSSSAEQPNLVAESQGMEERRTSEQSKEAEETEMVESLSSPSTSDANDQSSSVPTMVYMTDSVPHSNVIPGRSSVSTNAASSENDTVDSTIRPDSSAGPASSSPHAAAITSFKP